MYGIHNKDMDYKYVAAFVGDLAITMKIPQELIAILEGMYKFKTKDSVPLQSHLGMKFQSIEDGTLCMASVKYLEKMISYHEKKCEELPKQTVSRPLKKGHHPELDMSELLDAKGINLCQSLLGTLPWAFTFRGFDIYGIKVAPSHLHRMKQVNGYLSKMSHAAVRGSTVEPDCLDIPFFEYDWTKSVYGELEEMKPEDSPKPLGKFGTLSHYVDASLMHNIVPGKSEEILNLVNQIPLEWFSKKQPTLEAAMHGSEFVSASTYFEQIIDFCASILDNSYVIGDNKLIVDSSVKVNGKLHTSHSILSFDHVQKCIAANMVGFYFILGESNPTDSLSRHWGYSPVSPRLKAFLF
jgi:hypothetical protein